MEHVVGRALLDHARRIHHVHAVGVARHDAEIVRDDHQRDAELARQLLHQLRICAWMVTSSAVVGSSAMISLGLQASPIAIITRWRMPPENWCGYWSSRRSRVGDADQPQQLDRARARLRLVHA